MCEDPGNEPTVRTYANLGRSQVGIDESIFREENADSNTPLAGNELLTKQFNKMLREHLDTAAKDSSMLRQWAYMALGLFDGIMLSKTKTSDWNARELVASINDNFRTRMSAKTAGKWMLCLARVSEDKLQSHNKSDATKVKIKLDNLKKTEDKIQRIKSNLETLEPEKRKKDQDDLRKLRVTRDNLVRLVQRTRIS